MRELFEYTLKKIPFKFERVFYNVEDLYYHIGFDNNGKVEIFRMKKDEEGMWKIQAQVLPLWIHEMELELNDVIRVNETSI
ncbi:MAG: hypothetical protein WDO71_23015 [Bacteroidota bacterium]